MARGVEGKNFLEFYLEPGLLTEEEAKKILQEEGADIAGIETKKERLINKLEAKLLLVQGEEKKKKFEKIYREFEKSYNHGERGGGEVPCLKAARNEHGISEEDLKSDAKDVELLKFLKNIEE